MRNVTLGILLFGLIGVFCGNASATPEPVRVNASSERSAEASYQRMMRGRSEAEKIALALAVMQINLQGVHSAYELVRDPSFKNLGIGPIKDQVAGMTADEIIALGQAVGTVKVVPDQP